jgi:hypothetical protein
MHEGEARHLANDGFFKARDTGTLKTGRNHGTLRL